MRVQSLHCDEIMANSNIGYIIGHLIFFRNDDLASRVSSNYVVSSSQEVCDVFKLILARQIEKRQVSNWLHFNLNLINTNPTLQIKKIPNHPFIHYHQICQTYYPTITINVKFSLLIISSWINNEMNKKNKP